MFAFVFYNFLNTLSREPDCYSGTIQGVFLIIDREGRTKGVGRIVRNVARADEMASFKPSGPSKYNPRKFSLVNQKSSSISKVKEEKRENTKSEAETKLESLFGLANDPVMQQSYKKKR